MENLRPIKINIFYDGEIRKITGKDGEEAIVSEGLSFANILNFIFSSHPTIPKTFIPGTVAFSLNGRRPAAHDILKDGDIVKISAMKLEDIRKLIEQRVSELITHYQIGTTFNEVRDVIFNEKSGDEFQHLTNLFTEKISDINEANMVLQVLNDMWNCLPHKSLEGLCPLEKLAEQQRK